MRRSLRALTPQKAHQVARLDAHRVKFVPRVMLHEIRVETQERGIVGVVVAILGYLPHFLEGCGVHAVQAAKVADERPSQGSACWDGRKGVRKFQCRARARKRQGCGRNRLGYR